MMTKAKFILVANVGSEKYMFMYGAGSLDEVLEEFWHQDYEKSLAHKKEAGEFLMDVMEVCAPLGGQVLETYKVGFNALVYHHYFDKGYKADGPYTPEAFHKDLADLRLSLERRAFKNDATSLFFYMWNCWSEEECKKAFADGDYNHFWNKWCGYSEECGRFGAVERFYAELSNDNRDKLLKRACEMYDGSREKY